MRKLLLVSMLFISPLTLASELKSPEAKELASELKQTINTTISKIAELEKHAGNDKENISLFLQQDSKGVAPLGLVLNSERKVLLVTPSSQADNLGVESGDQIISLRLDKQLIELSEPLELKDGQAISIELKREKETKTLTGSVSAVDSVGWKLVTETPVEQSVEQAGSYEEGACGRVSVFFRPPETKDYYGVFINQINDENINKGRSIVRLKPGKHKLKLNELIQPKGLTMRRPFRLKGKILEIEVEPNKNYHLAAKFDSSKRYKSKGEQYWEPIVWKVADRPCEL